MNPSNAPIPQNRLALPLATTLMGALLITGCLTPADRDAEAGAGKAPTALSQEEGLRILESMGFSRDNIQAAGTHFVVEDDMVYTAEALARHKASPPTDKVSPLAKTAQRVTTFIRTPKPNLLKLAIHSSMSDWAKYVHQGVNTWNAPNTRLHIEVVPMTSAPDIIIYSDASADCPVTHRNLPDNVFGRADPANEGLPGRAISINKNAPSLLIVEKRAVTITHELGHTIGFAHTDGTEGTLISNTPESDGSSIMNANANAIKTLSFNDLKALEILYPSDKLLGGTDLDGDRKMTSCGGPLPTAGGPTCDRR